MASALRLAARCAAIALLVGCGATPPPPPAAPPYGDWLTRRGIGHPLVGLIWSTRAERWLTPEALSTALREAHFVLLGEKHDNPDHHRLQAWLLDAVLAGGRHGAVAFEMLDEDDVAPLAALDRPAADDVARATAWARSGWPPFVIYRPVFQAALSAGARLVAAHPDRQTLRSAMTDGIDGWPRARRARLGLDRPLPAPALAALRQTIVDTHCGHAPAHIIDPMALAQQVKDAWMAWRLSEAADTRGAVLIAGGEHVRRDRGVPHFLSLYDPRPVASVSFREVADAGREASDYAGSEQADYVWFTPRLDDSDPCDAFREQLERLRQRKALKGGGG